jgi:hypothetical protein
MRLWAASLIVALASLVSTVQAQVWVVGPSVKVMRNQQPGSCSVFDSKTGTVALHAARNEFVSFQIVFAGDMKGVNVEALQLKNAQSTLDQVEMFHEHYIPAPIMSTVGANSEIWDCKRLDEELKKAGAPREFPVQMVPLGAKKYGAPFDVAPGKNEVVWVDIFVPEKAESGEYAGSLKAGGKTLPVKLKVWNFTLPSVSHFPQWVSCSPEWIASAFGRPQKDLAQMGDIVEQYFQAAHNHRFVLTEEWYPDTPKRKVPNLMGYATGEAFKGPFGAGLGAEVVPVDAGSAKAVLPVIEQQKWLNRAFVILGDEPNDKDSYQEVLNKGKQAKADTGSVLRTFITEQYEPSDKSWPRLDEGVDIFCSGLTPPATIPAIDAKGKVVWTYNNGYVGGPYIDAPGVSCRTHAWAGFLTGSRLWYFWDALYIVDRQNKYRNAGNAFRNDPKPYLTDVWNNTLNFDESEKPARGGKYGVKNALRLNGDGLLIYPGTEAGVNGPILDFRCKAIRQGGQDFEYLYLLEKMGKAGAAADEAKKLLGEMAKVSGTSADGQMSENRFPYDGDGDKWDAARIRLGNLLDQIGEKAIREKVAPWNEYPNPVGHPSAFGGKRY